MRTFRIGSTLLALWLSVGACATAQQVETKQAAGEINVASVPPKETFSPGVVNDYAPVFAEADRKRLETAITTLRDQCDVDSRVIVVMTLGGASIEQFSIDRARQWHLGAANHGRGLLITLAVEDRRSRIEVSRELEATLPNERCAAILAGARTAFQGGQYVDGLTSVIQALARDLGCSDAHGLKPPTGRSN